MTGSKDSKGRRWLVWSWILGTGLACGLLSAGAGVWLAVASWQKSAALPANMPADAESYGIMLGALLAVCGVVLLLVFAIALVVRSLRQRRHAAAEGTDS